MKICRYALRHEPLKHKAGKPDSVMPKIDKFTSLYEHCEKIANAIRGKRNLASKDTATIALLTVIDETINRLSEMQSAGKSMEDAVASLMDEENKVWRAKTRDVIQPLFTAAKNYQNTWMEPSGLLPEAKGEFVEKEEFV